MTVLTVYGKLVRKARLDAGVTMREMAEKIGMAPSFLSAAERGDKKVTDHLLDETERFFKSHGIEIQNLKEAADVSNGAVSLKWITLEHAFFVARLARTNLTPAQISGQTKGRCVQLKGTEAWTVRSICTAALQRRTAAL